MSVAREDLRTAIAIAVALTLAGACSARQLERSGGERPLELEPVSAERANVTIEVKAALLREPDIDAAAIQVSLDGERVVLEGFVGDEREADRALTLARETVPGREVVSELVVP